MIFLKGAIMKTFMKITATFLLALSCLYLSLSLFLSRFVVKDVIPSVIQSSTVTAALTDFSDQALQNVGLNRTQTQQLMTMIQNDVETQEVLEDYVNTLLNDVIYQENTFDKQDILAILENKKDVAYEILKPQMSQTEFDQKYQQAVDQIDLDQFHQTVVNNVTQQLSQDQDTKDVVTKVYQFYHAPHVYIALTLLIITTAYLIFCSLKEEHILYNSMMVIYILSGILSLLMAVLIIFVLSALAPSTMTLQISSIRYMYICGFVYIVVGIVGYIVNIYLKRRT